MYDHVKFTELKEFEKHIILLFNEMKIKFGLVHSKSFGMIIGFNELGDINEELYEIDGVINGVNQEKKLASHVLWCYGHRIVQIYQISPWLLQLVWI